MLASLGVGYLQGEHATRERVRKERASKEKDALEMYKHLTQQGWTPVDERKGVKEGGVVKVGSFGFLVPPPREDTKEVLRQKMLALTLRNKEIGLRIKSLEEDSKLSKFKLLNEADKREFAAYKLRIEEAIAGLRLTEQQGKVLLRDKERKLLETKIAHEQGAGGVNKWADKAYGKLVGKDTYFEKVLNLTPDQRRQEMSEGYREQVRDITSKIFKVRSQLNDVYGRVASGLRVDVLTATLLGNNKYEVGMQVAAKNLAKYKNAAAYELMNTMENLQQQRIAGRDRSYVTLKREERMGRYLSQQDTTPDLAAWSILKAMLGERAVPDKRSVRNFLVDRYCKLHPMTPPEYLLKEIARLELYLQQGK